MKPSRRALLTGGLALAGASGFEALSLTGHFDNRKRVRARSGVCASVDASMLGVTHIGQSTHLIHLRGKRVLTDPWFSDPAFGTLAHTEWLGCGVDALAPDVICITHDHPDHADVLPLDVLSNKLTIECVVHDASVADRLRALGFRNVVVMKTDEQCTVSGVEVHATKAVHDVSEIGFVLSREGTHVYFAGDTREHDGFSEIAERYPLDLAILPVDGTRVRGASRAVMGPEQAMMALSQLRPKVVMPSHADAVFVDPLARYVLSTTVENAKTSFSALARTLPPGPRVIVPVPGEAISWKA